MARVSKISLNFNFSYSIPIILCLFISVISANRELNEDNWREILEGEWMVEFYAPWCPACNALSASWKDLAKRLPTDSAKTAAVDVTKSPGLSGRFVVTALPTIFHVKDGEFRQYKGPRDVDSMLQFVQQKRWQQTEPIPSWKSPDSIQMTVVAHFFKLSQALRTIHNTLMETYGLPTWGSYLIFAIATIIMGAFLGLVLVCIIDLLYPPRKSAERAITREQMRARGDHDRSDDEQELINDDIVDDEEDEDKNDSDGERNSPSDTSEEEEEDKQSDGAGDKQTDKPQVRKRRPRKAD